MINKKKNQLTPLLTMAYRHISAQMAVELKPVGISIDMWIILGILKKEAGQSMTVLADCLSLNLPTVTKLMDRMVSENLTYRKPHHSDRRRVLIFPTDKGLSLFEEADGIIHKAEHQLEQKLGDLRSLKDNLSKLY